MSFSALPRPPGLPQGTCNIFDGAYPLYPFLLRVCVCRIYIASISLLSSRPTAPPFQVVVDRIFRRIVFCTGLPVFTGMALFPIFYWLRVSTADKLCALVCRTNTASKVHRVLSVRC